MYGSNHCPLSFHKRLAALLLVGAIALSSGTSHAQPALEVRSGTDASVTLRWPASSPGFALESTPALGSTANWTAVSTPPTPSGIHFQVTVRPGDQARFFRLRQTLGPTTTAVADVSPGFGETGVAVTRETIVRFTAPLAPTTALTLGDLHAEVGGRQVLARTELSTDRRTATLFYLENLPGSSRVRVTLDGTRLLDAAGRALDADGDGQPGGIRVLEFTTAAIIGLPNTIVRGRVFASEKNPDGSNRPLEAVTITVDGAEETLRTVTDADGSFVLSPAPAGRFFVHVDGRTAAGSQWPGGAYYPFVGKAWEAIAGFTNNLAGGSGEVFLPRIQSDALQQVSETSETRIRFSGEVLASNPALAGVEVSVPANSLFSDNGARGGRVGIAPVPPDRLPEPLPPGLDFPVVITVQTDGGSNFDQPVPVRFPNLPDPRTGVALAPGAKTVLWSFNHDTGRWEPQGTMTISADGRFAVSDPGVGIRQPGWHGTAPGTRGSGPGRRSGGNGNGGDSEPDCEGDDCECVQDITCVIPKEGKSIASCALNCLGNVVDDIFGDGEKPQRTAFETGLRCIGGPAKCPGRPEDTLDKKRRDCMDECTHPLADRVTYTVPCEGFVDPCGSPALHNQSPNADITGLIPDRLVEQRKFWEVEGEFLIQLTGTDKILESDSAEVPRLTAFFDALADRVQPGGPSGVKLSPAERSELIALPRPAQFTLAEWTAMIDRLDSIQGQPLPANLARADQRLTALTEELTRRGWEYRGDGLLHGLARRSRVNAPALGSPDFPARAHYYLLKDHRNGFIQRGRLNPSGQFDGLILSPGGYYSIAYFDPVTRRAGVAFFQARQVGITTVVPSAPLAAMEAGEADVDSDGLSNVAETILGTSSTQADSDKDGVSDGEEISGGTNPLDGVGLPIGVVSATPAPGIALDVAAGNGLAVLATTRGLAAYDVSNPVAPIQLSVVPGNAKAVSLQGTFALGAFTDGIRLIDFANPAEPRVVWFRSDILNADAVTLSGSWAYIGRQGDLHRLDWVTGTGDLLQALPTNPIQSIAVRGDIVYALAPGRLTTCRSTDLLQVITNLPASGSDGAGNRPRRLFLDGPRLYAQHNFGFNVLDLSNPAVPTLVSNKITRQAGWRQFVPTGTGLALAAVGPNSTGGGLQHVSLYRVIANGLDVEFLSTFVTPGSSYAVAIAGARAFVADGTAGLVVINYLAPDLAGIAPTATVTIDSAVNPPVLEGGTIARIAANVSDDIAVRQVDLLVDGNVVARDDSYPFEIFVPVPPASPTNPSLTARVRAVDLAGNETLSSNLTLRILLDGTPPAVASIEPAPNSDIPPSTVGEISVTFNEAVAPPITDASLTLLFSGADGVLDTPDDTLLPGTVEWLADSRTLRLKLAEPISSGRLRATLAPGLADAAGNARPLPVTWQFATGAFPTIIKAFPPANYVQVGGRLDELVFEYDQPLLPLHLNDFQWQISYRTASTNGANLGPPINVAPIQVIRSPDRLKVTLRTNGTFAPGYYVVTGFGSLLNSMRWEFYFRDVPNEAIGAEQFVGAIWKYPPGVGIGDELIINVPGKVVPIPTFGVRSIIAYTDAQLLRQRVEIPSPLQFFAGLNIANTTFGPGVTDVHGPTTFTASFVDPIEIGPHTLNLRGGGFSRTFISMRDAAGSLVNHANSTFILTNLAGFNGSDGVGGRIVNLGTLRSVASTAVVPFDDVLLRNDGRLEISSGTTRVGNLENEGVVEVANGAKLHLPTRLRAGASSRITGAGSVEFGAFDTSRRRVTGTADAEVMGDFDIRGNVTLTAGTLTFRRPLIRTEGGLELLNSSTLRLTAPSQIHRLDLPDGNLHVNSDTEIGSLTIGSRADLRTVGRLKITGDARIGSGFDSLGTGIVELAGTTLVTNGTQSGGVYLGNGSIRNTGTWRQSMSGTQGSVISVVNENGRPGIGIFENAGVFELVTTRPFGIHVPFRNSGRMSLSSANVSIDASKAFLPPRNGSYQPQPGCELVLNNTTFDHAAAGTLDLAAGTVRGTGSILALSTATRPKVINRGVIRPGNPIGNLIIRATDGFEQTATGELVITLSPAGAGSLRLDSTAATLGGTLTVQLADGFSPAVGQTYNAVGFSSRTGEFTTLNLPALGAGKRLEVVYGTTGVTLRVVSQ
jgi:hypothetical protein